MQCGRCRWLSGDGHAQLEATTLVGRLILVCIEGRFAVPRRDHLLVMIGNSRIGLPNTGYRRSE